MELWADPGDIKFLLYVLLSTTRDFCARSPCRKRSSSDDGQCRSPMLRVQSSCPTTGACAPEFLLSDFREIGSNRQFQRTSRVSFDPSIHQPIACWMKHSNAWISFIGGSQTFRRASPPAGTGARHPPAVAARTARGQARESLLAVHTVLGPNLPRVRKDHAQTLGRGSGGRFMPTGSSRPSSAVGADGLLFQRMVGGCRAGRSRATLKASMAGRLQ